MLSVKECREHHWGSDGRCSECSMQRRYFYECMATLNRWTEKEKADPKEDWQGKVDGLKCHPHLHVPMTTKITLPNDNPIKQLYDMEQS